MHATRIALVAGIAVLAVFVVISAFALHAGLIACGNLLYGRRSRYARAQARTRPAQEAHDRAADLAADARRAAAEADRRGERYCPLDPANSPNPPSPHRRGR